MLSAPAPGSCLGRQPCAALHHVRKPLVICNVARTSSSRSLSPAARRAKNLLLPQPQEVGQNLDVPNAPATEEERVWLMRRLKLATCSAFMLSNMGGSSRVLGDMHVSFASFMPCSLHASAFMHATCHKSGMISRVYASLRPQTRPTLRLPSSLWA